MIDTIKFLIPIQDDKFLEKIKEILIRTSRVDQRTDDIKFQYYTGEFQVGSYERTVGIYLTEGDPKGFFAEFSLPKQYLNNNVEMINAFDIPYIIKNFRNELCKYLKNSLPPVSDWIVYRLDVCYNWTFESREKCLSLMNFIQRIDFPRKKKYIYNTSVMYKGTAYTIKFYLKGDEFMRHDFRDMQKLDEEKALQLINWANKVLRFEVEFKRRYFKQIFDKEVIKISDISNNEVIEKLLQDYLALVFRYINKENMKYEDVRQLISSNFRPAKALRLYQFYKGYYFSADEKFQIMQGLNSSTIYRYKKDLKKIGVAFEENLGDSDFVSVEELVIPSKKVRFGLLDYKCNSDYI